MKRGILILAAATLLLGCQNNSDTETSLPNTYDYRVNTLSELREGFQNPPLKSGPWVYWFWFDSVLSKEHITYELEELAQAGIGGFEVRDVTMHGFAGRPGPLYSPEEWEKWGHRKYRHMSPEYIDILEHTLSEAERLGLYFSMNLGQGWPPGGRWITDEHRSKHLMPSSRMLSGPRSLDGDDTVEVPEDTFVAAWKISGEERVTPDSYLDLTRMVGSDGRLEWEVPEGDWLLGLFQTIPGGLVDKGEGPEVDPASKEAVLFHLDYMFGRMSPKLKRFFGTTFADIATDSWEFVPNRNGGRYWSPAIYEASEEELGYDIRERMYALLGYGPNKESIEADLATLEETLVRENFFGTITEYLNELGIRHRPQAYGRGLERNFFDSYAVVDTPEIEEGKLVVEAVWTSRLLDKPITSVEGFTFISVQDGNLERDYAGQYGRMKNVDRNDMWKATPEKMIQLSNAHFGRGINRIQMHCFSYSPLEVPHPGWRLYAEAHINRNASWWPEMPRVSRFIARNQFVMQSGVPITDNLVYPVKPNFSDGPYNNIEGQPGSGINSVNGANTEILRLILESGELVDDRIGNIVLRDDIRSLEEAEYITALVEQGISINCLVSLPSEWSVFAGGRSGSSELLEELLAAQSEGRVRDSRGKSWKEVTSENQSAHWQESDGKLSYQRRRVADAELFLISSWEEPFDGEVTFVGQGETPEIWEPKTGNVEIAEGRSLQDGSVTIPIKLKRNDSVFVVFSH